MWDIYAILCDEKEKKQSDSPNTLFSLGYYINIKTHILLLPMISKHTTKSAGNISVLIFSP